MIAILNLPFIDVIDAGVGTVKPIDVEVVKTAPVAGVDGGVGAGEAKTQFAVGAYMSADGAGIIVGRLREEGTGAGHAVGVAVEAVAAGVGYAVE